VDEDQQKKARAQGGMSDDDFEAFVEHVSERIINNIYTQVGRGVVDKIFKFIGLVAVALLTYAGFTGKLTPPT
jgi:hypothetical protein